MIIKNNFNEQCITYSQMNLISNARIFWRRFTTWIRVYLISRYAGIGTAEESFGRLYLEATDFGQMLRIIFGRDISNRYAQMLRQFTIGLRELISAQLDGDTEAVRRHVDDLYKLTAESASFLASINPYLDETEWRTMFDTYLQYTFEEANSFLSGDYGRDIEIFDRINELTNRMGDMFAQALFDYITANLQAAADPLQPCIPYEQMNEIYDIRMFWFEVFTWLRAYMLSRYAGIGNVDEAYARLMKVPVEYIEKSRKIYGDEILPALQLINTLVDLFDSLIIANIENNVDEINRITQLIYQFADEGAVFLASILPYWDQNEWRNRLDNIVRNTIEESNTFLTKEYARNLDIFSTLLDQAENASDYIAQNLFNLLSD